MVYPFLKTSTVEGRAILKLQVYFAAPVVTMDYFGFKSHLSWVVPREVDRVLMTHKLLDFDRCEINLAHPD